ncbi:ABC transporter substrate-binding protein [Nonomuraea sp. NEAU-A123]|uniref:ABC transporter substrate-binding protein n=1 Tax=Nonomuraea sp. NEAU-A123 TaxID=2839649 RepID=UPI001BE3E24F|nr:ABC transporter substrate-binding protein [Nonomuraea sp. NEAU-A123]MBT2230036.1 ABC transporter substrate-binding protein [Nonomuraea sp. NEAU-A123]MBT2230694.1 ABC transporter substrate-binding protein [Nonomuraea sp. NEAU-A123]
MSLDNLSRRRALGLGLGALVIGAAGCGGGGGGPKQAQAPATTAAATEYTGPSVSLKFWNGFTGGDGPVMKKLVDQFNAEHQNIKVSMNVYQWADYYAKVPAAVSAGQGPDLGIMHVDSVATNAARQVVLPLDDVANALSLTEADFSPPVWKAGAYKGARYSIPLDVHPLGMFYNKTVMKQAGLDPEQPPKTGEEYMTALEALKKAGIQGHWATPFPFTGSMQFGTLLYQNGGQLFADDAGVSRFAEDPGVHALTWLVDLVNKGYSPKNVGQDADFIALQNGKAAFNWNGIWSINTLKEIKNLEWGVAPLPQIGAKPAAWAGSHQFVVFKQRTPDQNKLTAAKVFINWISGHSLEWAKGGQVPARKSIRDSAEFAALKEQATIGTQIDYLYFLPSVAGIGDASAVVDQAINAAILLKKSPKDALTEAAAKADKILEANRKKYGA